MYSPQLLDHFEHPRNAGEVSSPDASIQIENPVCGDVLKLTLKLADGRIEQIRFLAKGCVPSVACASAATELIRGKNGGRGEKIERGTARPRSRWPASRLPCRPVGAGRSGCGARPPGASPLNPCNG